MMPITLSIVEDHNGTRDLLISLLGRTGRISCLNAYVSAEGALVGIPNAQPDVALVDINLPGMNGIELVKQLKLTLPNLRLLILTSYEENRLIFDALRAGASGYLLKKAIPSELVPAIELVHSGGAAMSAQIAWQVANHFQRIEAPSSEIQKLSKREQEVLQLLAKGFLYKEIADQLGLGLPTVKWHISHIYEKLHVQTRTEATAKFLERGS